MEKPQKTLIIGTAGHIDHGKTQLVKALTGVDTDVLKEEKERGITIQLGFAPFRLPSGISASIIDVPGHEKFVRTMVAGAWGIDAVILVIAADEGIMPQTVEHLEICDLLGVKKGVVAITKKDLVDEEWISMLKEEVKEFLKGTFLDGSPIVAVSSSTGENIDLLIEEIDRVCVETEEKSDDGIFILPVDRSFSLKGFGTVVTGTLVSGKITIGDDVEILPQRKPSRVRGIQVHNEFRKEAYAGERTALNLINISREEVKRGDLISHPGILRPSKRLYVHVKLLQSHNVPLKNATTVSFHIGTAERKALLLLMDRAKLEPDSSCFAELRLDEEIACLFGDRFIIRSLSPLRTIGGGFIVHPHPTGKRSKGKVFLLERLPLIMSPDYRNLLDFFLEDAGFRGMMPRDAQSVLNIKEEKIADIFQILSSNGRAVLFDSERQRYVHVNAFNSLKDIITKTISSLHQSFPLRMGFSRDQIKSSMRYQLDEKLFDTAISTLHQEGTIGMEKELIFLQSMKHLFSERSIPLLRELEDLILKSGLQVPDLETISMRLKVPASQIKELLDILVRSGSIVRITKDLFFHSDSLEEMKRKVLWFFEEKDVMSVSDFKNIFNLSRKYAIPLLEYLDNQKITTRIGDVRKLRGK
uniref:Selenocysteine-specific elongation factor n=1 Tax=uncultured prokaryote TaxID=198431 RepID=H5SPB4_9ZZZZ|nr:selenocysteine-specific translation elongation factor [uncultured prokaryote]